MRTDTNNPPSNLLPPSTTDKTIIDAIEASGYPLQGIVTSKLLGLGFRAVEEWGYIDRDTDESRAIDVNASKDLTPDEQQGIFPDLSLLIECKRSVHPFVFFKKVADFGIPGFPVIAGCPNVELRDSTGRSRTLSFSSLLCADQLSFAKEPPLCSVFSRAVLSGKQAELSGEEPYKGIILPLVKVLDYVRDLWSGTANDGKLYPKLLVTICVVHSPMVLVESPQKTNDPVLTPWLRVARQEAKSNKRSPWESSHQHYAIDVVHVDFFDSFVKDKLLPFAAEFFQRASRVAEILRRGGVVDDVTAWKWGETITPIPRKTS